MTVMLTLPNVPESAPITSWACASSGFAHGDRSRLIEGLSTILGLEPRAQASEVNSIGGIPPLSCTELPSPIRFMKDSLALIGQFGSILLVTFSTALHLLTL